MDTMSLRELQSLFARLVGQLIVWIYAQGWEVTFGDFSRVDGNGHMANSCHYIRLAADLNLFVAGVWKDADCPEWQQVGAYWESLHSLARWGGKFHQIDLNHFSLTYNGRS